MNILVTGSKGQLGKEIQILSPQLPEAAFFFTDLEELDISRAGHVSAFCQKHKIDFIVNCAAYTAVDKAEDDRAQCALINTHAVEHLARTALTCGAKLIHISTDYVFDGRACSPYRESDKTSPQSVYGRTKLEGEQAAIRILPESIIIRTSWLYSAFGHNFVKTMMRLGRERQQVNVVCDQIGTPTYAADLATAILEIIKQGGRHSGIFHFSNEGVCSWYDFAHSIMQRKNTACRVNPVDSSAFPTKAARPPYSVLNKQSIKDTYHLNIPHWEESLQRCLELVGA